MRAYFFKLALNWAPWFELRPSARLQSGRHTSPPFPNQEDAMRILLALSSIALPVPLYAQEGGEVEAPWHPDATIHFHDDLETVSIRMGFHGDREGTNWYLSTRDIEKVKVDLAGGDIDIAVQDQRSTAELRLTDLSHGLLDGEVSRQYRDEWSFRARMTVHSGTAAGIRLEETGVIGMWSTAGPQRPLEKPVLIGGRDVTAEISFPLFQREIFIQVDAFGDSASAAIWAADNWKDVVRTPSTKHSGRRLQLAVLIAPETHITLHEVWASDRPIQIDAESDDE